MPKIVPTPIENPAPDELGYFFDAIHGRISLHELPEKFHPALRAALASPTLNRLRRISQLGHTSLSFFSATHTRFSHALGTMLVMNKLYRHVRNHLASEIFTEVADHYTQCVSHFRDSDDMVHCHLLLAALYQDVGELPFQKVTSLYFVPDAGEVEALAKTLACPDVKRWSGKNIYSILSLKADLDKMKSDFEGFSLAFLSYLITGHGAPRGTDQIQTLRQLVDGVIDADRLDYVYRDASVTIGSLSFPNTVLESIIEYNPKGVVVSDPRPVADFLSTRMRLWTFVYTAADVRFRQALLKTVLDGRWETEKSKRLFAECSLDPELKHEQFLRLDDVSLAANLEELKRVPLKESRRATSLKKVKYGPLTAGCRMDALKLLLTGTLDYECHILKRLETKFTEDMKKELPNELFFDLLRDHRNQQLYRNNTIFVRQVLPSRKSCDVALEGTAGSLGPILSETNSAILVPDSFFFFVPNGALTKEGSDRLEGLWPQIVKHVNETTIFSHIAWEDARRSLTVPTNTLSEKSFKKSFRAVNISYCSNDFPIAVRVVRELHRLKRRYLIYLRPLDGIGLSPAENSIELIEKAEAVLLLVSKDYVAKWADERSFIAKEIRAMRAVCSKIPIVPLGVDTREELGTVKGWNWCEINEKWDGRELFISDDYPLRDANDGILCSTLDKALEIIDR